MPYHENDTSQSSGERGFALVTVLWIAGLLAVLSASLAMTSRTSVRVAANIAESAKAEALADGVVTLAIIDLIAGRRSTEHSRRFPLDGTAMSCTILNAGLMAVSINDESSKINVNTAGVPLLRALLSGLGEPPEQAAKIADAIFDFRDADSNASPNGAEAADYRAANLGWAPKNAPYQSVEEVGQVLGVNPALLARMRPYLTVHSGVSGFDVNLAADELIRLVRIGVTDNAGAFGSFPELDATVTLPSMFVSVSQQRIYSVRVEARTMSGAIFVRHAIVDLGFPQSRAPVFLRWARPQDGRGSTLNGATSDSTPHC